MPDSLDEISAVNVKKALISERPTGSSVVGYSKVGYWYKKGTSTEWSRNMIISVKFNNFFWLQNLLKNEAILKIKIWVHFFFLFFPICFCYFGYKFIF